MNDAPTYDISVQVQITTEADLPLARIEQAVTWVLRRHKVAPGTGISVVITTDDAIQRMNRQFRAVDRPTDVLSFPADPLPVSGAEEAYSGDLILALPYIQRQAAAEGHTWQDELVLAVVHGALHLLDYDHDTPAHQTRMWAVQAEALTALNVPLTVPEFTFDDAGGQGDTLCD